MGLMIIAAAVTIAVVFFVTIAVKSSEEFSYDEPLQVKPIEDFSEEQNSIYLEAANELIGNEIDVQPKDIENRLRSLKPFEPIVEAAMEVTDYDAVFNWDVLCEAEDCGIGAVKLTDIIYPDSDKNYSGEKERAEKLLENVDEKHHYLIYIYIGLILCNEKKYDEGRAAFEKSVELLKSDLTLYALAFSYIDEVDPKITIKEARKALQIVKGYKTAEYLLCYYIFDTYRWEQYIPKQNPPMDLKECARLVLETIEKISFKEKSDQEQMRLEIAASWSNMLGVYNTMEKYEKLFESGYSDSSLYYECYLFNSRKGKSDEAKKYLKKAKRYVKLSFLKQRYGA